jgi:nucleoside-diphosphate-sugar epimerase
MRVLITGAAGFIGQHLVARLAGDPALELFPLYRSVPPSGVAGGNAIKVDIGMAGWPRLLPKRIDTVIHLAQSRSHREFPDAANDVFRVNVDATFELLDWSRGAGVGQFLYASTGSVYRPQDQRLEEEDAIGATSFYAATKIAGEALCVSYAQQFETTILRFFGVYGPGSSDSVLPRLMQRVARGETIELDGGVGLVTTPTFVADCVEAIVRCMAPFCREGTSRVFNICGDEEVSLLVACKMMGEILRRPARVKSNEKKPIRLSGSNDRAKSSLHWSPTWVLREGLATLPNPSSEHSSNPGVDQIRS